MPRPLGVALRVWNKLAALLGGPAEAADPLQSGLNMVADRERVTAS
jgi:hypothetical protein